MTCRDCIYFGRCGISGNPDTCPYYEKKEKKMCEFISWIEYKGEILFLTKNELETNRGKALRKHLGTQLENDVKGHGAIEWYYNMEPNSGLHRECTDFSSPDNFPRPIVSALKKGAFCGIGISEQLLTKPAFWKIFKSKKNRIPAWR